jgi:hypothetical protein
MKKEKTTLGEMCIRSKPFFPKIMVDFTFLKGTVDFTFIREVVVVVLFLHI